MRRRPRRSSSRAGTIPSISPVASTALSDWLDWMGLQSAGEKARLDRLIGYYEPYATSHDALDSDTGVQEEVRNAARTLAEAVGKLRAGRLPAPGAKLKRPRPK